MKRLLIPLLLAASSFAQSKVDYSRYTQIWVVNTNQNSRDFIYSESNLISSRLPFTNRKSNKLSLYIPENNRLVFPNGNKYIRGYLINNSSDTISIDRCDATIYPAETQILVNSEWKTFQISMGSTCGNSYFKAGLLPNSYYSLRIQRPTEGDIPTDFRVKLKIGDKEYFSNTCSIKLTREEIQKANITIKPLSL